MDIKFAPEWVNVEQRRMVLEDMLGHHDCNLTFTKVNGEQRVMPCTLRPAALPAVPVTEGRVEKKPNPDVMSVWCLDAKSWRSFRVINAISCEVINENTKT